MSTHSRNSEIGEPTWEIASLFPMQGAWSEEEYLRLDAGRLVEFDNGKLEVLEMPTELHQAIAFFICLQIRNFITQSDALSGVCFIAPLRVKLWEGKYREPDVLFMLERHRDRRTSRFWNGADFVVEIISDDDPNRDLLDKRSDYARAGITEYWIVDPRDRSVLVLALCDGGPEYVELGRFSDGQSATSGLLSGFAVDVTEVFDRPEVIDQND